MSAVRIVDVSYAAGPGNAAVTTSPSAARPPTTASGSWSRSPTPTSADSRATRSTTCRRSNACRSGGGEGRAAGRRRCWRDGSRCHAAPRRRRRAVCVEVRASVGGGGAGGRAARAASVLRSLPRVNLPGGDELARRVLRKYARRTYSGNICTIAPPCTTGDHAVDSAIRPAAVHPLGVHRGRTDAEHIERLRTSRVPEKGPKARRRRFVVAPCGDRGESTRAYFGACISRCLARWRKTLSGRVGVRGDPQRGPHGRAHERVRVPRLQGVRGRGLRMGEAPADGEREDEPRRRAGGAGPRSAPQGRGDGCRFRCPCSGSSAC